MAKTNLTYKLDVREKWDGRGLRKLRAIVDQCIFEHQGKKPAAIIIAKWMQVYLSNGLGGAPWKTYCGVPLEVQ